MIFVTFPSKVHLLSSPVFCTTPSLIVFNPRLLRWVLGVPKNLGIKSNLPPREDHKVNPCYAGCADIHLKPEERIS